MSMLVCQTPPALLAVTLICVLNLCVHFNILPYMVKISQLWLGYSFDSGVVGLEINVGYWF